MCDSLVVVVAFNKRAALHCVVLSALKSLSESPKLCNHISTKVLNCFVVHNYVQLFLNVLYNCSELCNLHQKLVPSYSMPVRKPAIDVYIHDPQDSTMCPFPPVACQCCLDLLTSTVP